MGTIPYYMKLTPEQIDGLARDRAFGEVVKQIARENPDFPGSKEAIESVSKHHPHYAAVLLMHWPGASERLHAAYVLIYPER